MIFGSIPSPSSGTISIGPVDLTAYGLCIALGVIAGVALAGRRFEDKGIGTRDDMSALAVGGVLAGVIGARLYHVATDWEKFEDNLGDIPKIWEGGLGIPGGLLLGTIVGVWMLKRRGIPAGLAFNAAAPSIALAQAIGRWGNYFNQELYGRPTARWWAIEIDDDHLLPGYPSGTTFHPTFLYESIWNLFVCGALLLIDRRFSVRPWHLLAMYVVGYGFGRFFIEGIRIDEAKEFADLRLNQWTSIIAVVAALGYLAYSFLRPAPTPMLATAGNGAGGADVTPAAGVDDGAAVEEVDEVEEVEEVGEVDELDDVKQVDEVDDDDESPPPSGGRD